MARFVKLIPLCALGCLFAACRQPDVPPPKKIGLQALDAENLFDESIKAHSLDSIRHLPQGMKIPSNPYYASDSVFVNAIGGASSQGQLDGVGVSAAFYGLYEADEIDFGIYGLQASSELTADDREEKLHQIWGKNISLDRARVHRDKLVLILVWHDGIQPELWDSVNAKIDTRLSGGSL